MAQRNDPCPCGSGRKFKKCCGSGAKAALPPRAAEAAEPAAPARHEGEPAEWGATLFRHGPSHPTADRIEARRSKHLKQRLQAPELRGSLFYSSGSSSRGRGS